MGRVVWGGVGGVASWLLFSSVALAGSHNASDFPLRVHIFQHNAHSMYYHGNLEQADGEGRANLFENGEPQAFDYSYRCGDRLMDSAGYETYMARWKKKGQTLELLLPVMGKPNAAETCDLKVNMKPSMAYRRHNGLLSEEPASSYKQWMEKHEYDPEHGKNEPIPTPPQAPPPAAAGAHEHP